MVDHTTTQPALLMESERTLIAKRKQGFQSQHLHALPSIEGTVGRCRSPSMLGRLRAGSHTWQLASQQSTSGYGTRQMGTAGSWCHETPDKPLPLRSTATFDSACVTRPRANGGCCGVTRRAKALGILIWQGRGLHRCNHNSLEGLK